MFSFYFSRSCTVRAGRGMAERHPGQLPVNAQQKRAGPKWVNPKPGGMQQIPSEFLCSRLAPRAVATAPSRLPPPEPPPFHPHPPSMILPPPPPLPLLFPHHLRRQGRISGSRVQTSANGATMRRPCAPVIPRRMPPRAVAVAGCGCVSCVEGCGPSRISPVTAKVGAPSVDLVVVVGRGQLGGSIRAAVGKEGSSTLLPSCDARQSRQHCTMLESPKATAGQKSSLGSARILRKRGGEQRGERNANIGSASSSTRTEGSTDPDQGSTVLGSLR
jgi:hypothetical protein